MKMFPRIFFSLPALAFAAVSEAATTAPIQELPAHPFHLESHPSLRWDVTINQPHGRFRGVVYYAVPPDDPCQSIKTCELYAETREGRIEAAHVTDGGPYRKPLLKLAIDTEAPFHVIAHVDVQFHNTALQPGPPTHPVRGIVPAARPEYLDDDWPNERARAWFKQWMTSHSLLRGEAEEADAFAFRVLQFIQGHFRYVIPDNIPEHKAMVEKDPVMGDWHYTINTGTGECWRLSDTYCRVMRMNGIPARLVSGNYVGNGSGHHLRSLIYLEEVGWVPIEATAAVSEPKQPTRKFFGSWGGSYLAGNRNIDFELPGPKDKWNIGTLDGLAFGAANGKWEFPDPVFTAVPLPPVTPKGIAN
ncbi:MAG: transglutaminase-like domain-containing protein [Chthoniobacter sp.]|nr:transglutaminase-like domain-containing protein [Chthoniobacter sp.]